MKKPNFLIAILAVFFIVNYSCSSDVQEVNEDLNNTERILKIDNSKNDTNSKIAFLGCGIDGPISGCPGQTVTYTYTSNFSVSNILWSVTRGNLTLISGQGTTTATFLIGNFFSGGWVQVLGSGLPDCFASQEILKCGSIDNNDSCECPSPFIDDRLCVSGGHPHWRFQVDRIQPGDQITWSIDHGTIHSNPNQSYVIIEPNSSSIYGFTVLCKVVRTCSDGTTKERTAYYTNYYGNNCGTGTTGFKNSCGGASLEDI